MSWAEPGDDHGAEARSDDARPAYWPQEQAGSPLDWTDYLPALKATLAQAGHLRLPLRGSSMRPTLPPSCEVELTPLSAGCGVGDVVVLVRPDGLVAHRIVRRRGDAWITQGDGRRSDDGVIATAKLLGRVEAAFRDGRRIWPGRFERAVSRFWVARHLALRAVRSARRPSRRREG